MKTLLFPIDANDDWTPASCVAAVPVDAHLLQRIRRMREWFRSMREEDGSISELRAYHSFCILPNDVLEEPYAGFPELTHEQREFLNQHQYVILDVDEETIDTLDNKVYEDSDIHIDLKELVCIESCFWFNSHVKDTSIPMTNVSVYYDDFWKLANDNEEVPDADKTSV